MRKRLTGVVTSDRADKTRRVEIERRFKHPKYGKYVRSRTVCHVHDERNESHVGDLVEIIESRPRSKTKRWDLVRIIERPSEYVAPAASEPALEAESAAASPSDAEASAPQEESAGQENTD